MNIITKTTELAMEVTLKYIEPGDTVIDATCGTGRDTVALACATGETGRVVAFDIQEEALSMTEDRMKESGLSNYELKLESFKNMGSYVPEKSAACVVFNLGYLPGGDHSITTEAEETIQGLEAALKVIRTGGIVTVVLYDGHPEGKAEKQRVLDWAENLNPRKYHVGYVNFLNQKNDPPEILWITKKV